MEGLKLHNYYAWGTQIEGPKSHNCDTWGTKSAIKPFNLVISRTVHSSFWEKEILKVITPKV